MKKIAFVIQRYGLEVNGGAELHCRQLAERMSKYCETEIITTKAIDYVTWKDEYTAETDLVNGLVVHRFSVDHPRNNDKFRKISETVLQCNCSREQEEAWMKQQGPYSSKLIEYLRENKDKYDVFIFFTYLYCTTYFGLKEVGDKAILIPTAHDERPIYLGIFKQMFQYPRAFFYNTAEEKMFVEKMFGVQKVLNNDGNGGVGVDVPALISAERFKKKYGIDDFIVYIGRIEEHKGCKALFDYFREYKKRTGCSTKLVLMGKEVMKVPKDKDIISLGFVSDEDKFDGIAASRFLLLPSQFESLSMVVLEAMSLEKAVLIQGKCEVVKGHCIRSNGGLYYTNYYEFEGCMDYLLSHPDELEQMGKNGKKYVDQNYQWDAIVNRLNKMVEMVSAK